MGRRKYDDCGFDEDNISTDEVDQFVVAFFGEGARGVDGRSGDWKMNSIENYNRIDLAEVPLHMRDIVRIGLNYIVALDHQWKDLYLMQHSRVDLLYLMVGLLVDGELNQEVFDSEHSYTISYYDNPLQPGIKPTWSDQNVLGNRRLSVEKKKEMPRKELNFEEFQRRQKHALAMLENAPADPMAALEEKYRMKMLATEHDRQTRAIRAPQDIYENDAELDFDELEGIRAQQNGEANAKVALDGVTAAYHSPSSGDPELDNLLAYTDIARSQNELDAMNNSVATC